ncbi:protein of unknown function [Brevefilum fermentans]|uniref:Uncharacterized protein n=1 Tax=Candidatus Brevifilum fermentans TaxID=1986204 RepID=A0A1Y6K8L4_9CHLR|nr:protein of unknown function [Brevefilum fermentans]
MSLFAASYVDAMRKNNADPTPSPSPCLGEGSC